ncbi:MAG TPA: GntR family transcriptional regulator [Atopostipes sp.]|nr:GntR family transcriptional regulator [Atopostipes sp.]
MFIEIDTASSEPIYTQLMKELKKGIVKGEIKKDDLLPSVRSLAGDLGVNMHTVNKAYNLLVDEEILIKSQRGYRVDTSDKIPDDLEDLLKERLEELLVDIYIHDVPVEQVKNWTQDISKKLKREW